MGVDGLKGVGWLTALGEAALQTVGGLPRLRRELPASTTLHDLPRGVVVELGPAPIAGGPAEGLSAYRALFRIVRPLIEIAAKRSLAFNVVDDYSARTEDWYVRLACA